MGEMTCFQAMHVSLIMQHRGAGDINGSNVCLVSLGSYLFPGKVSPTPANCLWLAGINVYVPAEVISIVLTIVSRKEEISTELTVPENSSPCGSPTLRNKGAIKVSR